MIIYSYCSLTSTLKSWASLPFSCTCSDNSQIKTIPQSDFFLLRQKLLIEPEENCIWSQLKTLLLSTVYVFVLVQQHFPLCQAVSKFSSLQTLHSTLTPFTFSKDVTSQRKQKLLGKKKKKILQLLNPTTKLFLFFLRFI